MNIFSQVIRLFKESIASFSRFGAVVMTPLRELLSDNPVALALINSIGLGDVSLLGTMLTTGIVVYVVYTFIKYVTDIVP